MKVQRLELRLVTGTFDPLNHLKGHDRKRFFLIIILCNCAKVVSKVEMTLYKTFNVFLVSDEWEAASS